MVIFELFQHVFLFGFYFVFLKKNKKAPLAHVITRVVEGTGLDIPDGNVCVVKKSDQHESHI